MAWPCSNRKSIRSAAREASSTAKSHLLIAQRIALWLLRGVGAIQRLAEFAAINFRLRTDDRRHFLRIIVITLQVAVAELALVVFFIARALFRFARFDFG